MQKQFKVGDIVQRVADPYSEGKMYVNAEVIEILGSIMDVKYPFGEIRTVFKDDFALVKSSKSSQNSDKEIFDIEPQFVGLEDAEPEPSIREILYAYYREHFSHVRSIALAEQYIKAIKHYS